MNLKKILPSAGALAMLLAIPAPQALAQDGASAPASSTTDEEIVVTGTSIRGIAPAGSTVIGITADDIQSSGALSANEALAELPMANNMFNTVSQPGAGPGINAASNIPLPRVQLRPLPGQNTSSGMQTLILVDGHRLAPLGISAAGSAKVYVDPNVIAPGMLDRIEVITDGGSAIYGSDAVTGVINYITRRRFDGVQVTGNYGFADSYERWGTSLTAGKDWGSGSLFGSYSYSQTNNLFGRDRDWIRDYATPALQCNTPTVTASGQSFLPQQGFAPTTTPPPSTCDSTDNKSFAPATFNHSFTGGFSQDLGEDVRFDLRATVARNTSVSYTGPFVGPVTLRSTNLYFNHALPTGNTAQTVNFSYAPVFGDEAGKQTTTEDFWQITPELTWDVSHDWQFRGFLSHAETELDTHNLQINAANQTTALASANPLVAINPYDIASTNPAALALLRQNFANVGQTQFSNARGIFDGPLFTLPAGQVKAALGAEFIDTAFHLKNTGTNDSILTDKGTFDQTVAAQFAELQVPLVSEDMNIPFVHSLSLQGSIRHDHYNDFGDTTNSSYGMTYEPTTWISFYGNFSESFIAPTPIEQAAAGTASFTVSAAAGQYALPNQNGGGTNTNAVILLGGSVSPLLPQTSESYTFGFDVHPLDGLSVRASFWHTLLMGRLGNPLRVPTLQLNNGFYDTFDSPNFWIFHPTAQQIADLASQTNPADLTGALAPYVGPGAQPVDVLIDNRQRNLGRNLVEGWDINFDYTHSTDWGSWDARMATTIYVTQRSLTGPGALWTNAQTRTSPDYRATASVGANVGHFRGQATINSSGGFTLPTGRVDTFHPVDLFFSYDVDGANWGKDLRLTLNVNNVFDDTPEGLKQLGVTGANGFTVGRLIQLGVSKKF